MGQDDMSKVEYIKQAVSNLSPVELCKFRRWFTEFDAGAWDREIASDVEVGKLDGLIEEARAELRQTTERQL